MALELTNVPIGTVCCKCLGPIAGQYIIGSVAVVAADIIEVLAFLRMVVLRVGVACGYDQFYPFLGWDFEQVLGGLFVEPAHDTCPESLLSGGEAEVLGGYGDIHLRKVLTLDLAADFGNEFGPFSDQQDQNRGGHGEMVEREHRAEGQFGDLAPKLWGVNYNEFPRLRVAGRGRKTRCLEASLDFFTLDSSVQISANAASFCRQTQKIHVFTPVNALLVT